MADIKLIFVFACVFAFAGLSQVEAGVKSKREVEVPQETNQLEKVQQQLMTAFDSFKRSMEDFASKLNTEDIVQGVQNITSKLEGFAKQAADQFQSTVSGTGAETSTAEGEQPQPQPQPQP